MRMLKYVRYSEAPALYKQLTENLKFVTYLPASFLYAHHTSRQSMIEINKWSNRGRFIRCPALISHRSMPAKIHKSEFLLLSINDEQKKGTNNVVRVLLADYGCQMHAFYAFKIFKGMARKDQMPDKLFRYFGIIPAATPEQI